MRLLMPAALLAAMVSGCGHQALLTPGAPGPAPTISRIQPPAVAVGDAVTISGGNFTATANSLKIGAGYLNGVPSTDSTSIRFNLPSYLGVCPPGTEACVALALALTPGSYKVSVINANGTSNEVSLQVVAR